MADISLTASMRSNLLSLQNTQSLMDMTQERLSTGKKVNSAIDNPTSYYMSRSLTNRANDLDALLDSMGQGIQTIKAANEGIESITSFVEQAKAIANTARDTTVSENVVATGTFSPLAEDDTVTVKLGDKTYTHTVEAAGIDDIDGYFKTLFDNIALEQDLEKLGINNINDIVQSVNKERLKNNPVLIGDLKELFKR